LAKMLYAGESPRFILRRLLTLAGEDVGLADPMGLVVANAAAQAFEFVGLPEGVYPIVEATLYLATAPKSNSASDYFKAFAKVEAEGKVDVPRHLQDANRDAKGLGHGVGYIYPHSEPGHHVGQQYLPTAILGTYFYSPSEEGYEAAVKDRLARWRDAQRKALGIETTEEAPAVTQGDIVGIKQKMIRRAGLV
ncbi:MAG: AAA family ATPase, partial [Chloroflexi bacterium]|nr:AAA family ATPase [Chloroflexota bacterium]